MRLKLRAVAHVEVRSKGLVAALDHTVTFSGDVDAIEIDVGDDAAIDVEIAASLRVSKLEPPKSASRFDRSQMTEQLAVALDAARSPELRFRGRYRGTRASGRLEGELTIRGEARAIAFEVRGEPRLVTATWEGKLTELGVKPPKLLLGAVKLADWAKIRIEVGVAEGT
jgi:YceI-like domain